MSLIPVIVEDTELAEVQSSTRGKGEYKTALLGFLDSGQKSVKFAGGTGTKAGGTPTAVSIKSGFETAIKGLTKDNANHAASRVTVRSYESSVYLYLSEPEAADTSAAGGTPEPEVEQPDSYEAAA